MTTYSHVSNHSARTMFVPILLGAGVVTRTELENAQKMALESEIALEEALVKSGLESKENLIKISAEAFKQVEEKKISLDLAIRAVRLVGQKDVPLAKALKLVDNVHHQTHAMVAVINELTQVLLAAKMLSRDDLGDAIDKSQEASMMIGQYLVLEQKITAKGLIAALNAVLLIRDCNLDKDKAAQGLRYANQREICFEQALFELNFFVHPDSKTLRTDELFYMAGLLSPEESAECLEIELFKRKPFAQILLERGLISREQLEAAETLLTCISSGTLKPFQAADALRQVCEEGADVYATIAAFQLLHKEELNCRLGEILIDSDVCSREELEKAVHSNLDSSIKIGRSLLISKLLSESLLYCSLRVQTLLRLGYISRDVAINVVKTCVEKDCKLEVAFSELGVRVPSRMQWNWV